MKNIFYYLMLIFGLLTVSSCVPSQDGNGDFLHGVDYDPTTGTGGDGGSTTSKQLMQMISHLKDEETGQYEDANYTYSYTANKLTSYTDDSGEITKFEYNSNGKISKMSGTGQSSIFEYSGTNLSKVVTDLSGVGKITATYSYVSGKLSKIVSIQDYTVPLPLKFYLESNYTFVGENMTESVTKNGVYDPVTGDLEMSPETNTVSFTYDTKKSPYKLLPLEYNLSLLGIAPQGGNFLSANNALKTTIANSGAAVEVLSFTHTYEGDYPSKSTAGQDFIEYKYK